MRAIVLMLLMLSASEAAFVNGTVQKAFNTKEDRYAFSIGLFRMGKNRTYYEGGLILLPGFSDRTRSLVPNATFEDTYIHSLYGFYAGYHYALAPILRPGILVGTNLVDREIYLSKDGIDFAYSGRTGYGLDLYFGMSIQVGILSVILSNVGVGGGLNVPF